MLLKSELGIRFGCFLAVFLAMALWEMRAPRRALTTSKKFRWFSHFALVLLNSLLVRLIAPLGVVSIAVLADAHGWGLLNTMTLPYWLSVAIGVMAFDLAVYLQHVVFHAVPMLWRLHLVHHADLDFDVTTGFRFHTLEILLSFGIKAAVTSLLGPPVLAVLLFEIVLNGTAMFNHGNVRMPSRLDRLLRWIVVTPDMHRVHHSAVASEMNSNFGFNLPWWDYLFGSYCEQPAEGHGKMTIGLAHLRDARQVERLDGVFLLPFSSPPQDS